MYERNEAGCDEAGFKLDILKFQGCLPLEDILDWVAPVEILYFKEVPYDRRVALGATKFRGRATVW